MLDIYITFRWKLACLCVLFSSELFTDLNSFGIHVIFVVLDWRTFTNMFLFVIWRLSCPHKYLNSVQIYVFFVSTCPNENSTCWTISLKSFPPEILQPVSYCSTICPGWNCSVEARTIFLLQHFNFTFFVTRIFLTYLITYLT